MFPLLPGKPVRLSKFLCITGEASSSPPLQSSYWSYLSWFFAARQFKEVGGETGFLKLELLLLRQNQRKPEQNQLIKIRFVQADVRSWNFCGENENPKHLAEAWAMDVPLLLAAAMPNGAHHCFPHPKLPLVPPPGGPVPQANVGVGKLKSVLVKMSRSLYTTRTESLSWLDSCNPRVRSTFELGRFTLLCLNFPQRCLTDKLWKADCIFSRSAEVPSPVWMRDGSSCPLPASGSIRQHLQHRRRLCPAPCRLPWVDSHTGLPCASASQYLPTGSSCWACLGTRCFCGVLSPGESQWKLLSPCPTCHMNIWGEIDPAQKSCKQARERSWLPSWCHSVTTAQIAAPAEQAHICLYMATINTLKPWEWESTMFCLDGKLRQRGNLSVCLMELGNEPGPPSCAPAARPQP